MKNIIMQYYHFNKIDNYQVIKDKVFFDVGNDSYIFEPIDNIRNFINIYRLLRNNCDYIITNIYGSVYTKISNVYYALIKKCKIGTNILNSIYNNNYYIGNRSIFDKKGWLSLWKRKLDYYEYQLEHIKYYPFILESFNYYLGMGECAIAYVSYNISSEIIPLVLSHKRINNDNYGNPLNMTIDYRARDASGYLKYLFLCNNYNHFDMDTYFKKLRFNKTDFILLYGRLLFPSFYFDLYDEIINNKLDQKKIIPIIIRSDEYEAFLKIVYNKINNVVTIPKVDWLD